MLTEVVRPLGREKKPHRHRLLSYLLTVWAMVTLNFMLPRAMPGDPISAMLNLAGQNAKLDDSTRATLAHHYGLDQPLAVQYGRYLGGLARGDLGVSIIHNRSVLAVLAERLPWTLLLGVTSTLLPAVLGVVAGAHSGWKRGGRLDTALLTVFTALQSVPPFFLASMAVFVFAVKLHWFPLAGAMSPFSDASGLSAVLDIARHLALPAATMALLFAGTPFLLMRAGMLGELGADYLLMGRAKGLADRRLKYRYAARNAMLPLLSVIAVQLSLAVAGGVIFVETVFAYPGLGRLMFEAARLRDYPTLQGAFLLVGVLVISLNSFADSIYSRLDPRVRR